MAVERYITIIPAQGVSAEFKDGKTYPVIMWALRPGVFPADEGEPEQRFTDVVGLIIFDGFAALEPVDSSEWGDFVRYVYSI